MVPHNTAESMRNASIAAIYPVMSATPVAGTPNSLGVTELEAAEATLVPALLVAVTVNVYAVPLVRPVKVNGLDVAIRVILPGVAVTV